MNNRIRSALFLLATSLLVAPGFAAEVIFTPPPIPPGTNRVAFPQPRDDWKKAVQELFNKTQGKQFDLIFDGDSLTAGWNWKDRGQDIWDARYAKLNAVDFGVAGDQTQNVLWRLKHGELDGMKPKLLVLMIGSNNFFLGNFSPEDTAQGVQALIAEYTKELPDTHLLLLATLPKGAAANTPIRQRLTQLNTLIAAMADGKQITFLDFTEKFKNPDGTLIADLFVPDQTHPSAKGYQVWADAIQPTIDQYFPPSAAAPTPAP
jgi:lysophospholipase L1-like esterase